MADGDKLGAIVNDPDFQKLSPSDQQGFLSKVDPDFGKLNSGEFSTFLARYKGITPESQAPDSIAQARQVITQMNPANSIMMGGNRLATPQEKQGLENVRRIAGPNDENIKQRVSDIRSLALSMGGASLGPEAVEAGGSGLLPGVLRSVASGVGAAGGQVAGRIVSGQKPNLQETSAAGISAATGHGVFGEMLPAILPSASRAGATMNRIMSGAKDAEVPTFNASAEALRAKEIAQAGTSLPAPIRAFLKRAMNPDAPRMTLGESRDIYINASKMTGKEWSEFNAPMQRQAAIFTRALGDDIESAMNANEAGSGTIFRSAMDEYGKAMRIKALGKTGVKWGIGAAGGAGATAAGAKIAKTIWGKK